MKVLFIVAFVGLIMAIQANADAHADAIQKAKIIETSQKNYK